MKLRCVTDRLVLPTDRGSKLNLLVEVDSSGVRAKVTRANLNICLVLDKSESMLGKKMYYVKQAAKSLVYNLVPSDMVSIVTYSDTARTVVKPQAVKSRDRIMAALEGIRAAGRTNLSAGWVRGANLVRANVNPRTVNRVLLMSDGFANEGIRDVTKLAAMAQKKREKHVLTTALGFGDAFDEDLLVAMATAGGGNFYYIARPSDTLPVFAQEIKGLTFLVADELMMCVEPSPKVQFIRQLNDYDVTTEDGTIRTSLGGIFYHEKKNALFEFMVPPHLVTGRGKIADVWLEYVAVGEGAAASARRRFKRKTPRMAVEVNYGSSEAVEGAVINKEVVQEVELMQVAAAVSSAKEKVNEDDLEGAMQVLMQVRKFLRTRDFSEQRKKDLNQLLSHFYEELRLREDPARTRKAMTTTLFNLRRGKLFSE